jgi:hypothetical protein
VRLGLLRPDSPYFCSFFFSALLSAMLLYS